MKWYKDLFLGDKAAPDVRKIKRQIKNKRLTPNVYLISLASNPQNLLDVIPTLNLLQRGYPKEGIRVVGLAVGREEALEVVRRIVDETYQKTGTTNIRAYLKDKWRDDL